MKKIISLEFLLAIEDELPKNSLLRDKLSEVIEQPDFITNKLWDAEKTIPRNASYCQALQEILEELD